MSLAHKVVFWVMQRRGYLVRLNKRQNFFHTLLFCSKADLFFNCLLFIFQYIYILFSNLFTLLCLD